jgi:hypothetical protein
VVRCSATHVDCSSLGINTVPVGCQ